MADELPDDGASGALLEWLARHGGDASALRVVRYPGGERGVVARRDLADGDVIVRVPEALVVTPERARRSDAGRAMAAAGLGGASDGAAVTAWLLAEQGAPSSPWREYLASLPASMRHAPALFDDAELAPLEGTEALALTLAWRAALRDEHARLRAALPGFDVAEGDYLRARLTVGSRLFAMTVDGRATSGLVPVADMLNHARAADATWSFEETSRSFVVRALNRVAAGAPVHCRYGLRSNTRLFVTYGFALDDNPDDEAAVRVPCGAPLEAHARRLGGELRGGDAVFLAAATWRVEATRRLFAFLRVAAGAAGDGALPADVATERAALALLAGVCERGVAAIAGTADGDDALLAAGGLAANARNALLVRRSERRVLARLADLARTAAELLDRPRVLARRALAGRYDGSGGFDPYLRELATRLAVPSLTRR